MLEKRNWIDELTSRRFVEAAERGELRETVVVMWAMQPPADREAD